MDSKQLLEHHARKLLAACPIAEPRPQAPDSAEAIGVAQKLFAHTYAALLRANALGAQHQAREVELKLVPVARSIRTLHLAQATSVAEIDHTLLVRPRKRANLAVFPIDGLEQDGKRRAQIKAETAPMADVENPVDLLIETGAIPVLRLSRTVGKSFSWF